MKCFMDIDLFDCGYPGALFFHNNLRVNGKQVSLCFDKDAVVTVCRLIDADCAYDIKVNPGVKVKMTEIICYRKSCRLTRKIEACEGSYLDLVTIVQSTGEVNDGEIHENTETILDKGAVVEAGRMNLYENAVTVTEQADLIGAKSKLTNFNFMKGCTETTGHYILKVYHHGIDSVSEMTNFGICGDSSILKIDTEGIVCRGAIRSDIKQKTKGILIGKNAEISADPHLRIDEYDCMAAHGAAVGEIDREDLYYLMSRGLTEEESGELIVRGFANPLFAKIKNEKLKMKLTKLSYD